LPWADMWQSFQGDDLGHLFTQGGALGPDR